MPESTRATLLSRVRDAADDEAWRAFDARYRELILRYARARGLQPADAEDVRQLVMMALAQALRGFRYDPARGRFRSYLGRVVAGAVARFVERRDRHPEALLDDLAKTAAAGGDPAEDPRFEVAWRHHHFRLAIEAMRDGEAPRDLEILARLGAGEAAADVAAAHGMTIAAVYKVKSRLKERLRARIARQLRDEEEG